MKLTLRQKVIGLPVIAALLPVAVIIALGLIQRQRAAVQLTAQLDEMGRQSVAQISKDVYGMCETTNALVQQQVNSGLAVARESASSAGGFHLVSDRTTWAATNQLSKDATTVALPKMMLGKTWLGQNDDLAKPTPLVDHVQKMVGGTCTVFQRMNDRGDMLRVATNVTSANKTRAIGTYIPAVEPDGKPNAVIATVLKNETYRGRAFVVDAWYLTAYEPISDSHGVIGMLYVGVKQEAVESLRKAIYDIKIGKSGYVYVLGGKGQQQGRYIISLDGKRDGENIWEAKDADGNLFIQDVVNKSLPLKKGEVAFARYPWKNKGELKARFKVAALTYFEPWDWVIGASQYEDDNYAAKEQALAVLTGVLWFSLIGGMIIMIGIGVVAVFMGNRLARELRHAITQLNSGAEQVTHASAQIASASQSLASGASEQAASVEETSSSLEELSSMTRQNADNSKLASQLMGGAKKSVDKADSSVTAMDHAMTEIKRASDQTSKIIKTIDEIAFQTKGFAVVAEEVRNLARRSAEAAKNTSSLIEDTLQRVAGGVQVVGGLKGALEEVTESSAKVLNLVNEIAAASTEQAQGIEQVNAAVSQMNSITQQNASSAEESASAAEELSAQAETVHDSAGVLAQLVERRTD
jgi:methyl-accepting chemotaxis protein